MRVALNGSTLGPCSLDEELASAAGAGFRLVELRAPKLEGVRDLGSRLRAHGLEAWTINSLEGVGERDLESQARWLAGLAASCDCPYVVAVPGRRREGLEEELARLAATCHAEGAQLAFEFMGFEWAAVRTLEEAARVHEGPLVIDAFHWALGDADTGVLERIDPARIAVVHANDAPSATLANLGDTDRVLPGEGVLALDGFYDAIERSGYEGVYSVELFAPVTAERAFAAMSRLAADRAVRRL